MESTIYQHELSGYKKDSARSLSERRMRVMARTLWFRIFIIALFPFYALSKVKRAGIMLTIGMTVLQAHYA